MVFLLSFGKTFSCRTVDKTGVIGTSDNSRFTNPDSHAAVLPPLYLISYFPESGDKVVIVGFL